MSEIRGLGYKNQRNVQNQKGGVFFCIGNTDVIFRGRDIARHLAGCRRVYLIAVTPGMEIDRVTARLMREKPTLGVTVDSAAVCAVESCLDDLCVSLAVRCGEPLAQRFSCGYGDFPLERQKDFAALLDIGRRPGIYLGKDMLMTLMKSVTAAVGIGGASAGLQSALMTTAVDNMRVTVEKLRAACPKCRVMVGGAVLTPEYAAEIGADVYCRDAAASARYAAEVFGS